MRKHVLMIDPARDLSVGSAALEPRPLQRVADMVAKSMIGLTTELRSTRSV